MKLTQRLFALVFALLLLFEILQHSLGLVFSNMESVLDWLKPLIGFLFVAGAMIIYRKGRTSRF